MAKSWIPATWRPASTATAPAPAPSPYWYALAICIVLTGWGAMEATLALGSRAAVERMIRIVVPGQAELVLDEPGTYTIFHEYRSMLDGRVSAVSGVSGLLIEVRARPGGDVLVLESAPGLIYDTGDRAGRSLFKLGVAAAGRYQVAASYSEGRVEPRTVLAIGHNFAEGRTATRLMAEAFAFGSVALAGIVALAVFRRRRIALPSDALR